MPTIKTTVNADVDVEVEVEVFCATCGAGLCGQSTAGKTPGRRADFIEVEACKVCLDKAREEGVEEGRGIGYEEAKKELEKESHAEHLPDL